MGFFSWETLDGGRSIPNVHSDREAFPVVLLVPKEFGGEDLIEREYDGYGVFGGKDVYELLAQWNAPEQCNGDLQHDRDIGIDIDFSDVFGNVIYKLKFVSLEYYEKYKCKYEDFEKHSDMCQHQGYFYLDKDNIDYGW